MKGIRVEIYKWMGKDCSNRGVSSRKDTGTLYTMDGDGNYKSPSVFREPFCT